MKVKRLLTILVCSLFLAVPALVKAADTGITADDQTIKVDGTTTVHATCPDDFAASITSNEYASVSEGGVVTGIKEGQATVTVTCSKEGETSQSASVNITVEPKTTPEPSPDPSPSPSPSPEPEEKVDLTIKKVEMNYATFEKTGDTTYNVNVKEGKKDDFKKLIKDLKNNLEITLNDTTGKAKVSWITDVNSDKFTVTVTDGKNNKYYNFTIKYPTANVNLSSLKIQGYAFNQTFDKDTLSYTVTVPYDVREVTVVAVAEDSKATISPKGTFTVDELEVGGNTITIKVTNGSDTRTYRIFVTRKEEDEEEETDGVTGSHIKTKSSSKSDFDIPDTEDPDSFIKIAIITLASFILFLIGAFGVYFYFRTSPKRMKKDLMKNKKIKQDSPIVEINNDKEDLEKTKEFKNL